MLLSKDEGYLYHSLPPILQMLGKYFLTCPYIEMTIPPATSHERNSDPGARENDGKCVD